MMRSQMLKSWPSSVILIGLFLAACQASAGTSAATDSLTPDSSQLTAGEDAEVEIQLEVGPGSYFFSDKTAGLGELSSYTATLTVSFDGTEAGQAKTWMSSYVMLHTQEPLARLLTITTAEVLPFDYPSQFAEFGVRSYEVSTEGVCTVVDPETESDTSRIDGLEPAVLLHGVFGAEEAGGETISGVGAIHYTFDQRALIDSGISEASGEMWVATDGGTLLRYLLSVTTNQNYLDEGIEGTITWNYELTEINQTPPPVLPDICEINAPLLADASNVMNLPDWLTFDTASSVAGATAFYQEQLPALGWTLQPEPYIDDTGALLEFAQGDQILFVSISLEEGQVTRVNLVRGEPEE